MKPLTCAEWETFKYSVLHWKHHRCTDNSYFRENSPAWKKTNWKLKIFKNSTRAKSSLSAFLIRIRHIHCFSYQLGGFWIICNGKFSAKPWFQTQTTKLLFRRSSTNNGRDTVKTSQSWEWVQRCQWKFPEHTSYFALLASHYSPNIKATNISSKTI